MTSQSTSRSKLNSLVSRARNRSSRGESGATLVETAVSLLLLLILIFGVIEISWALYSYHFVSDAAREGTRYAIVRGSDWASSCDSIGTYASSGCQASTTDIADYVSHLSFPGIFITAADVCVQYSATIPASPSTTCTANTSPNAQGDVVEVQVNYPFTFTIPGLKKYTYNLTSTSQMVISQ